MFSIGEMEVLSEVSLGIDNIQQLSEETEKSIPQVYKTVGALREKGIVSLSEGKVIPERKTHIVLLLDTLRHSEYAKVSLSGHGLDVLAELTEPKSVAEVSSNLGLHQTSVSKKIKQLEAIGMVYKSGRSFAINDRMWPDLRKTAEAYSEYSNVNDMRAPPGSKVYYSAKDEVIFAGKCSSGFSRTAFSLYEENGIKFYPGTDFCISPPRDVTLRDVFIHSL